MMQSARVLTHPVAARNRFREIARLPEEQIGLTEASLVIALEEYPGLEVESYLSRVEQWSQCIRERVEGSSDIERIIEEINRFLFEQEGFHGEADDYYDPRNTFLNEVLDRHAGLPIALSILYIDVTRRLGLETSGVALPGRFLVRVISPTGDVLIDPFDDGRVLTSTECQEIMNQVFGGGVRLREHHLRSSSNREILARVLAHLKSVYLSKRDLLRAVASIDRLLILDARDPYELRDRGSLAMQLHEYADAILYLERYVALMPYADDVARVSQQLEYLRGWVERN